MQHNEHQISQELIISGAAICASYAFRYVAYVCLVTKMFVLFYIPLTGDFNIDIYDRPVKNERNIMFLHYKIFKHIQIRASQLYKYNRSAVLFTTIHRTTIANYFKRYDIKNQKQTSINT